MKGRFTGKQGEFIADRLSDGDFQNASEFYRDPLTQKRVLDELREEINKGWDGPASKLSVRYIIKLKTNK